MEWSQDVIGQLRGLWAEGHSTAEIGRRLGLTKNAIVGKAHRLDLPARPSPIRRDPNAAPVRRTTARRVEGPTLPPLPSTAGDYFQNMGTVTPPTNERLAEFAQHPPASSALARSDTFLDEARASQGLAPLIRSGMPSAPPGPRLVAPSPRPAAPTASPRPAAAAPRPYGRVVTCCWPIGEPGTREFHFCEIPSEPGRPYCEDHVKVAYVKIRDRREDAA